LVQLRPGFKHARELLKDCKAQANNAALTQTILNTLKLAHSETALSDMIRSIKPEIRRHVPVLQLEDAGPPRERTVTFLCSGTVEPWDATSLKDGVGGSETMVIQLGRKLARLGWTVEVFGTPKEANRWKKIDGVTWKPVEAFNTQQRYDVLVVWRAHHFLDRALRANKIFVDLHDVQDPGYFTPERVAKVDGYLFKSEFHAEPVRGVV